MTANQGMRIEHGILWGAILIDLLFASVVIAFLISSHAHFHNRLKITGHNLVQLLEQNVADKARLIDDAVERVVRELDRQMETGGVDDKRLEMVLDSEQRQLPEIDAIRVTNAAGDVLWGKGVADGASASYADREFFKRHREHTISDLIITEPIKGKVSGLWVIAFTRCYHTPGGRFAGVVSAAVPLDTFGRLLASIEIGKTGTVVLRHADMGLIARDPPIEGPAGRPGNKNVSREFRELMESGLPVATFHTEQTPDRVERTYAFRRVSGWPFTIAVGLVDDEFLRSWKSEAIWMSAMAAAFCLLTSFFAWMAVRHLRERTATEKARMEEEVRRRILIEQSRDGIVVLDQNGKVCEANLRYAEMLGYPPEELKQLHVWDWDLRWSPDELREMIRSIGSDGDNFETRHRRKDGSSFDVEVSTNGAELGGRKLVFCVCRDISERKQAQAALRESEARFRSLFDHNPDGALVLDMESRQVLMSNPQMCRMLGYRPEELSRLEWGDLLPEAGLPHEVAEWKLLIPFRAALRSEIPVRRKDGTVFPAEISAGPFIMDGRRCAVGLFRDVAQRKQVETALVESEEKYRRVFENELLAICIFDLETLRFIDVNDTYLRLYGFSREELLSRMTIHDITVEHEDSDRATQQAISSGTIHIPLRWHRKKDGTIFPVEIVGGPYFLKGRQVMFAMARDITERKQAEEALQAALREKEVLLREVHHRVKNNMQVISSLLTLQAERVGNEQARQALLENQQRVAAMAMIHEALYSAQDLTAIDLPAYLQTLADYLRDVYSEQVDVEIHMEVSEVELGIDQAVPCGLILNELITNAFKHAFHGRDRGTIQIKVHGNDREVVLEVRDDGVGLSRDMDIAKPSSLGLRLIQGLLKHQLQGSLEVAVDRGTAFILRWPLLADKGEKP